jgi:hypothetical protein
MQKEKHHKYAEARAIALLNIYRPCIPSVFGEARNVFWLLDADDRRACEVSMFIRPPLDLREEANAAGPKKRVVVMQLTHLSELNSYLCTEGQQELPPPLLRKGYIAVCSAGAFVISDSDTPEQCLLSL